MRLWPRKTPFQPQITGQCPIREHTADGYLLGRCEGATYEGYCPRHGNVSQFLGEDADLTGADDRLLPDRTERDFGTGKLHKFLTTGQR